MPPSVRSLFRYPVKGLSAEALQSVALRAGNGFPSDRRYALALAKTEFDASDPHPLRKSAFLMLMRNASLARLRSIFDDATERLVIELDGREVAAGHLSEPAGRRAIEDFFEAYSGEEAGGRPRLVEAPGHQFTDVSVHSPQMMRAVSLINLASIRALDAAAGETLDPLRFRANIYVDGLPAWAELGWEGRDVSLGGVRLHGVKRITRCAATEVNPATAERDVPVPRLLRQHFGHDCMGIYLYVRSDGVLCPGDSAQAPDSMA